MMNKNIFFLLFLSLPLLLTAQITPLEIGTKRAPCFQKSLDRQSNPRAEWECGQNSKIVDCNEKLESNPGSNLVYNKNSGKPFTGECELCYMTGIKQLTANFVNGKVDGIDTTFYQSGCPQVVRSHVQGIENGKWTYYNDTSGLIAWQMNYYNGQKEGEVIYFHQRPVGEDFVKVTVRGVEKKITYRTFENDTLRWEHYKAGKLDGIKREYWPKSELKMEAEYKEGLLHGKFIRYDFDGVILEELNYAEGVKNGNSKYFYNTGALMKTENWKKGIKDGEFINYYIQGYVQSKETYKNGLKHGEFIERFPDNKIKREAIFKKDILVEEHVYDKYGNELRTIGGKEAKNKKEDDEIPEKKVKTLN